MNFITFAHKNAELVKKPNDNNKNNKTGCLAQ